MKLPLNLDGYPLKTYEKLRYADTDRQGHVNSAVHSTMIETGRTGILFDPDDPLYSPGCSFVLASQTLNYHAEIMWPGLVDIGTRVAKIGTSSVTFEYAIFQEGRCACTASSVVVHINDATRRSEPFRPEAIARLENLKAKGA